MMKYITLHLTIVNKKTWQTCDFPVWERVKHIVPVYNAHPSYKIKNLGKNPAHYTTLNTVIFLSVTSFTCICNKNFKVNLITLFNDLLHHRNEPTK